MKRPNRDIAIFTLSALDVLAMSAGVFVLLLVMLMPYHRKSFDAEAEIDAVRVAAVAMRAEVQSLEATAARYRAEARAAAAEASSCRPRLRPWNRPLRSGFSRSRRWRRGGMPGRR